MHFTRALIYERTVIYTAVELVDQYRDAQMLPQYFSANNEKDVVAGLPFVHPVCVAAIVFHTTLLEK
jgi:hypothetical protein